jgi:hypothetical protein
MNFWKIAGFITGLFGVTLIAKTCKRTQIPLNDPDVRYNVDDFLSDQDL